MALHQHQQQLEELKSLYPDFDLSSHLNSMIEKDRRDRDTLERLKDSDAMRLYSLLKGNSCYIELGMRPTIEVDDTVDKDALSSILSRYTKMSYYNKGTYYVHLSSQASSLLEDVVFISRADNNDHIPTHPDVYWGK